MAEKPYKAFRRLRIKKGDSLKDIYAKVKRSFTAADLAQYAQQEEGIPARKVLAELERLAKTPAPKRKKK
jgi:hypothetical protein